MRRRHVIVFGIAMLGMMTGLSARAAATAPLPAGTGTLTLVASGSIGPITDDRLVLTATGPGGTVAGPPGTTSQVIPGSYALTVPETAFDQIYYRLVEIVCSNAPSGVSAVTIAVDEDVVCTFEFIYAVPQRPAGPPNVAPPEARTASAMPNTGIDTTVPAAVGTLLIVLGAGLVVVSRRRRPAPGR